jgi:hypothetical protein
VTDAIEPARRLAHGDCYSEISNQNIKATLANATLQQMPGPNELLPSRLVLALNVYLTLQVSAFFNGNPLG